METAYERARRNLDRACDEIIELKAQLTTAHRLIDTGDAVARTLEQVCNDTRVELEFWKRAAERALRLWERAQDDLEDTRRVGLRAAKLAKFYIVGFGFESDEMRDDLEQTRAWIERLDESELG